MPFEIVIDTSVVVSALRSSLGASHRLMTLVGTGRFGIHLSVPLALEYEAAAKARRDDFGLEPQDIEAIVDYLCSVAGHHKVHFLWRPALRDPADDMVLELAVAAGCSHIITHNIRDFRGSERFGIQASTPGEFLTQLERQP
jgi:putative PIN family toxin of toxin-antitoxin system